MGDEGFAPFDSLVEEFRVTLAGVFLLLVVFDWAGYPIIRTKVSISASCAVEEPRPRNVLDSACSDKTTIIFN